MGSWVRGNLHGHCRESSGCSSVPLLTGIERHRGIGARFVALTDHDRVTDLTEARTRWPDMTFLEGFEWSRSQNILFIGEKVPPLHELSLGEALRRARDLLTVVCHPKPYQHSEYWTVPMVEALDPSPVAIEVYNAHYSRPMRVDPKPNPLYAETWDALLTRGMRLWGLANDDSHDPPDYGRTATMACVRDASAGSLMEALRAGRFYGTTGLLLDSIEIKGETISVGLASSAEGRFVGPEGRVLSSGSGRGFLFRVSDQRYVRFEAEGGAGRIFLQPFFRE